MTMRGDTIIAVVGLGYVGLPLAVELGKKYQTIGYDLSQSKILNYQNNLDPTGEVSEESLKGATNLSFSSNPEVLTQADVIIVAVPTPVDAANTPDLAPLINASSSIGQHMKKGVIVVYESTVYPGATEEICVPILQEKSGFVWKKDFNVGYSPERINPGDKSKTITDIVKIVSGDDTKTLIKLEYLYGSIVQAGIHCVSSIKVAEAAKVIENTQRDLNIALMNELSMIFNLLNIDTFEVLKAAGTKWNFLPFRPGLVGGHCIGVDPYYLTHKAGMIGYNPQVILAGRKINDEMPVFIAQQTVKELIKSGLFIDGSSVTILGLTFKENCSDTRNSKVINLIQEFLEYGCNVQVHDPLANEHVTLDDCEIKVTPWENLKATDALVLAVAHDYYLKKPIDEILLRLRHSGVFVDVKSVFEEKEVQNRGFKTWRL